jgi:hypothetical protein
MEGILGRKHRHWSIAEKRRIVAEANQPGTNNAAVAYTLIETAKLNGVDPQPWLTDTLARIAVHKNCFPGDRLSTAEQRRPEDACRRSSGRWQKGLAWIGQDFQTRAL